LPACAPRRAWLFAGRYCGKIGRNEKLERRIPVKTIILVMGLLLMSPAVISGPAQAGKNSLIEDSARVDKSTLFYRLGGKSAIAAVVGQFVAYNNSDDMIAHRWKTSDVASLKEYLTELVCQATGGPCVYGGKSMDVAHAGLKVTETEFNRVAVNLGKALDKFNVPQKEKSELLAIIGSLKGKVVGQ
jgi:hemoglobin